MSRNDDYELIVSELTIPSVEYLKVETTFTIHYIEKLTYFCQDRGRYKWIAQTRAITAKLADDPEAKRSHIDHADCFPRYFFGRHNLASEFMSWILARHLTINHIKGVHKNDRSDTQD